MSLSPIVTSDFNEAVDLLVTRCGPYLKLAAPLGIGKPHRLLNAVYARVAADASLSLHLQTALSLTPPSPGRGLQRRFLEPFLSRQFGDDFPQLDYARAQRNNALPANVQIEEFYMQSGGLLNSEQAQRSYASLNYTMVAANVARNGVEAVLQKVARKPGESKLSLSSNPDLTFDLIDEVARLGRPRPLLIAEIDDNLPWLDGPCAVQPDFFDLIIDPPGPTPQLFATPRAPVVDAEYAIGFHASALVRDGGTLQIGIGSLADALCHALILRHTRNAEYRAVLDALAPGLAESDLVRDDGGVEPFKLGLYGASEMVNDGFRALAEAGILSRRVVDDVAVMARSNRGLATVQDRACLQRQGRWLDGAFYLGSKDLYRWLRELPPEQARGLAMMPVSRVNQLYSGDPHLLAEQRRDARYFNTCMMMTMLGAAMSETLDDGRVVSGVGGQYNFVAMAHALPGARSILMLRASRGSASSLRWDGGQVTIPRHLRDIAITEYGIADLRGRSDEDCVIAMLHLVGAAHQPGLVAAAKKARKLDADFVLPPASADNTSLRLHRVLAPFRATDLLPDYPLGSDFTAAEQRLAKALAWLQRRTATRWGAIRTVIAACFAGASDDADALQRMDMLKPKGLRERIDARLLSLALRETGSTTA